jgi:hypothetical protein
LSCAALSRSAQLKRANEHQGPLAFPEIAGRFLAPPRDRRIFNAIVLSFQLMAIDV